MTHFPLRFCMISTFYPPYHLGGTGVFVHNLSNELARRGHSVHVIHSQDAYRLLTGGNPTAEYEPHPNIVVHDLGNPLGILSLVATHQTGHPVFQARQLRAILSQGFDVIHYHNVSLIGGPQVLAWGDGIKLYTLHNHWLVCPTHELFRFNRLACHDPRCLTCTLIHKRPPQWWRYSQLIENAVRHVDRFLAPARFMGDKHAAMGLDIPVTHLPPFLSRAAAPLPDRAPTGTVDKPYFLFVGRLEKLKGLHTLIPLFRDYPKAQLLIAGTGSFERHLRQLADGSENVHFLGRLSQPQLQPLYRHAVALVVPSVTYEVAPLVIGEAFRQRTPAIVRNLGAMPEIVHESGGGLAYDTDDELIAAMNRLVDHPAERDRLGKRGYDATQQLWSPEAHLARYFAIIEEVAAEKRQNQ